MIISDQVQEQELYRDLIDSLAQWRRYHEGLDPEPDPEVLFVLQVRIENLLSQLNLS
jgi:hypothetical protein